MCYVQYYMCKELLVVGKESQQKRSICVTLKAVAINKREELQDHAATHSLTGKGSDPTLRQVTPITRAGVILANKGCRSGFLYSVFPSPSFTCNPRFPLHRPPPILVLLDFRRRVLPLRASTGCPGHCRRAQGRTTCWVPPNSAYKGSRPDFLRRQHPGRQ